MYLQVPTFVQTIEELLNTTLHIDIKQSTRTSMYITVGPLKNHVDFIYVFLVPRAFGLF